MRHPSARFLAVATIAVAALLGGCTSGAASPSAASSMATMPSASVSAAPSAAVFPAELVGSWTGSEHDFDSGETWVTTLGLEPCRQNLEPWWRPKEDQRCGEWTGEATIEGRKASCTASLSWLESDGDTFVLMGTGPLEANYRTIPHPFLNIDERWYCWDSFRIRLTPTASGTFETEYIGAGSRSGAFTAMAGTLEPTGP